MITSVVKFLNLQKTLTFDELREIEGGFVGIILVVGAVATVCVAVYEVGKAVGKIVYHTT